MWEVPHELTSQWAKVDHTEFYAPNRIDTDCPNPECRRSLVNIQRKWAKASGFLHSRAVCAACRTVNYYFVLEVPKDNGSEALRDARLFQFPKPPAATEVEEGIEAISPAFVEILGQAEEAEHLGLTALVGIGYRKALEFLIKDHLVRKHPDQAEEIARKHLGNCISSLVTDPNIKACAERASWLANDETHYERRWRDKDIEDLKVLLKLTRYWISSEHLTETYSESMRRGEPG